MTIFLPFPPSVNSYWRSPTRGALAGRHLISARGRQYRIDAMRAINQQLNSKIKTITKNVSIDVVLFQPNNIRRDLDNFLKAPLDALTHARVWEDDNQVKKIMLSWGENTKNGEMKMQMKHSRQQVPSLLRPKEVCMNTSVQSISTHSTPRLLEPSTWREKQLLAKSGKHSQTNT